MKRFQTGVLIVLSLLLIAATAGVIIYISNIRETVRVSVFSKEWQRQIFVDEYKTVAQSDWCDNMPADAFNVVTSSKKRGSIKIKSGDTSISIPYNGDWCDYSINTWELARVVQTSGGSDEPTWGSPQLNECTVPALGCSKIAMTTETYRVVFESPSTVKIHFTCEYSLEKWKVINPMGQRVIDLTGLDKKPECDTIFR